MRCGSLINASAAGFRDEMLQTGERQIRQDQPVGAQFLEEADLFEVLGKAFGSLVRRHGTKPFAPADAAVLEAPSLLVL